MMGFFLCDREYDFNTPCGVSIEEAYEITLRLEEKVINATNRLNSIAN